MIPTQRSQHGWGTNWRPTRRQFIPLMGAAAAAVALVPNSLAMAAGTSSAPAPLQTSQSGTLVGNTGGVFDYYEVAQPNGQPLTLTITVNPFNAQYAMATGVGVYQNGTQIGIATSQSTSASVTVTPSGGNTPVIVQVFNYSPKAISYTLTTPSVPGSNPPVITKPVGSGTPAPSGTAAPAAPATTSGPAPLALTQSGNLPGNTGGSFAYYQLIQPNGKALVLNLAVTPFDARYANAIGVNVTQNGNQLGTVTSQSTTATLSAMPASGNVPATIQVFNYSPNPTGYTLTTSELPSNAPAQPATPAAAAAPAPVATAAPSKSTTGGELAASQTGTIPGNTGGAFAYYTIAKPTGSTITLTMSYNPYNAVGAHSVGFAVIQSGTKLGQATGTSTGLGDPSNSTTATLSVTPSSSAGAVTIQVFNYTASNVNYTLTQS